MTVPVSQLGAIGIVRDTASHSLALNAWSDGGNVRFIDGAVEKILGDSIAYSPAIAPYALLPVVTPTVRFWVQGGLAKIYAVDNAGTPANITRQVAGSDSNYNADATVRWNGGVLGGVPILNNGNDVPQMWRPTGLGHKLQDLTNWPSTLRAKVVKPFKQYLVALNVTKSGTNFPYTVKWSHPADPGDVPVSWDETDSIRDSGEYSMSETGDYVVDAVPLGRIMVIYKEDNIWSMASVADGNIFGFDRIFKNVGVLNHDHVLGLRQNEHLIFTGDDLVWHNGIQMKSVIQGKWRRWLRKNLDTTYFKRSFLTFNPAMNEVWLCFPSTSSQTPDLALIWNWIDNTLTMRGISGFSHAAPEIGSGFPVKRLFAADPLNSQQHLMDDTEQFHGANPTCWVERRALALPFNVGEPPDISTDKNITRVYPHIEGTVGGLLNIYTAMTEKIDELPNYGLPKSFVIGTDKYVDVDRTGKLLNIKFESDSNIHWRLSSYEVDVKPTGKTSRS